MDIKEYVALIGSIVAIITSVSDLLFKYREKQKGPFGKFHPNVNAAFFIVAAALGGWFLGQYSRQAEVQDLYRQKEDLVQNLNNNVRIRDKALNFYLSQMQLSSEEFNRISGHLTQELTESAILYDQGSFQGMRLFFPLGEYPDLHQYWFGDKARSVKLRGNVMVVAYEDTNFGGPYTYIRDSIPDLSALPGDSWSNRISSLKVIKNQ